MGKPGMGRGGSVRNNQLIQEIRALRNGTIFTQNDIEGGIT